MQNAEIDFNNLDYHTNPRAAHAAHASQCEKAEIRRRWQVYIDQLPEYAYLCEKLLSRNK